MKPELTLAHALNQHLGQKEMSQRALAAKTGLSPVTINRIFKGKVAPHRSNLEKLIAALALTEPEKEALFGQLSNVLKSRKKSASFSNPARGLDGVDAIADNKRHFSHVKFRQAVNDQLSNLYEVDYIADRTVIDLYHSGRRIGIQCIEPGEASVEDLSQLAKHLFKALRPKRLFFVFNNRDKRIGGFREVVQSPDIEACGIFEVKGQVQTVL